MAPKNGRPAPNTTGTTFITTSTTTRTGLTVYARLDQRSYPDKIKVTDTELAAVQLQGDHFHPEWNYTIKPRR